MTMKARYAHTNLTARDWKRLVDFYREVFGCTEATPRERLSGQWLEQITRVAKAEIQVVHLRLPGHGEAGPTLEVIGYGDGAEGPAAKSNRPGFGHIAFAVDDVAAARDAVVAAGGKAFGEVVSVDIPGQGRLTETYVTDPEGNLIELQNWSR